MYDRLFKSTSNTNGKDKEIKVIRQEMKNREDKQKSNLEKLMFLTKSLELMKLKIIFKDIMLLTTKYPPTSVLSSSIRIAF